MSNAKSQPDCIFCKIVRGEVPCERVYEDAHALAFLDIQPLAPGHTLVIPKAHAVRIGEMQPGAAAALFETVPRLARAIIEATAAEGLNVLQNNGRCAGQVVEHVHVHLIPRSPGDKLGFRWITTAYAEGQIAEVRDAIASRMAP